MYDMSNYNIILYTAPKRSAPPQVLTWQWPRSFGRWREVSASGLLHQTTYHVPYPTHHAADTAVQLASAYDTAYVPIPDYILRVVRHGLPGC